MIRFLIKLTLGALFAWFIYELGIYYQIRFAFSFKTYQISINLLLAVLILVILLSVILFIIKFWVTIIKLPQTIKKRLKNYRINRAYLNLERLAWLYYEKKPQKALKIVSRIKPLLMREELKGCFWLIKLKFSQILQDKKTIEECFKEFNLKNKNWLFIKLIEYSKYLYAKKDYLASLNYLELAEGIQPNNQHVLIGVIKNNLILQNITGVMIPVSQLINQGVELEAELKTKIVKTSLASIKTKEEFKFINTQLKELIKDDFNLTLDYFKLLIYLNLEKEILKEAELIIAQGERNNKLMASLVLASKNIVEVSVIKKLNKLLLNFDKLSTNYNLKLAIGISYYRMQDYSNAKQFLIESLNLTYSSEAYSFLTFILSKEGALNELNSNYLKLIPSEFQI